MCTSKSLQPLFQCKEPIGFLRNHLPHSAELWDPGEVAFLETFWEKEKVLVTSTLFFFLTLSKGLGNIFIVMCKCFQVRRY